MKTKHSSFLALASVIALAATQSARTVTLHTSNPGTWNTTHLSRGAVAGGTLTLTGANTYTGDTNRQLAHDSRSAPSCPNFGAFEFFPRANALTLPRINPFC